MEKVFGTKCGYFHQKIKNILNKKLKNKKQSVIIKINK
jgi:hypothetical protein